jgi:hypothetical protein
MPGLCFEIKQMIFIHKKKNKKGMERNAYWSLKIYEALKDIYDDGKKQHRSN